MAEVLVFQDLEKVYDLIAAALDEAGAEKEALLLSKLCLILAHNIKDVSIIEEAIGIAKLDLASALTI
jgi:hypothetical protein